MLGRPGGPAGGWRAARAGTAGVGATHNIGPRCGSAERLALLWTQHGAAASRNAGSPDELLRVGGGGARRVSTAAGASTVAALALLELALRRRSGCIVLLARDKAAPRRRRHTTGVCVVELVQEA